MARRRRRWLAA